MQRWMAGLEENLSVACIKTKTKELVGLSILYIREKAPRKMLKLDSIRSATFNSRSPPQVITKSKNNINFAT